MKECEVCYWEYGFISQGEEYEQCRHCSAIRFVRYVDGLNG